MDIDPAELTISSALARIRAGEISAASLTSACRAQIERLNPAINAYVCVAGDETQATGPASSGALPVPVAVKDLIDVAGLPTTAGAPKFFGGQPAETDAFVIEKLRLAGAVILGKTNTHEIALGVTGVNPHFGPVRNPHDLRRVTGGSSSGSAAAVAAGMCLAALGTDTGGSIRIPASLCGVVGLKPTYGRVSTRGVLPLSWNLDHVGPLTRSVRDAALMLQVLAGYDPLDPASADAPVDDYLIRLEAGVAGWRVAVAAGEYVEAADPEVLAAVGEAARVFKDNGAQVEKVDFSWLSDLAHANARMTQADAAAFHRERLAAHPDWFGEDVCHRLEKGAALTSGEYVLARREQAEGRRRFEVFFHEVDALLLPTTPIPAPPIEGTEAVQAARQLTHFTSPFNLTGLPALSVPCGLTLDGLPVGLQIVSRPWAEALVLQAGRAFEQAVDLDLHPSLPLRP
jgi:aspartyl-tRNA(Asn)/glutamyl-tRNA(Gln) amidotransferase subunit A